MRSRVELPTAHIPENNPSFAVVIENSFCVDDRVRIIFERVGVGADYCPIAAILEIKPVT